MKKYFKYILFFVILYINLTFNASKVLAADCIKQALSGSADGVFCSQQVPGLCQANCASGWLTSCPSNMSIYRTSQARCYIHDANCNNIATCYMCSPKLPCTCDGIWKSSHYTTESYTATGANCTPTDCYGLLVATAPPVNPGSTPAPLYCFSYYDEFGDFTSLSNPSDEFSCENDRANAAQYENVSASCSPCGTTTPDPDPTPYVPSCTSVSPSCYSIVNQCSSGDFVPVDSIGSDGEFNWNCVDGCSGSSVSCSANSNSPPIFQSLAIKNNNSVTVDAEPGDKNQICQNEFNGSRQVTFVINAGDPDGDTLSYSLSWNGKAIATNVSNNSITFDFPNDSTWNNGSAQTINITVTDTHGASDFDASRYFKVWDCNVSISGAIYDNSDGSLSCSNPLDPAKINSINVNFTSLTFTDSSGNKSMTITQPSSYASGANSLIWGKNYGYAFNSDFAVNNLSMKVGSLSTCQSTVNLNNTSVDPYTSSPTITADFFGVANQDPWWQAASGGVVSNDSVINKVPVTCSTCKMSPSGLISAPNVTNTGRPLVDAQAWYYKAPTAKLAVSNTSYSYFLSQYHDKNGIGTIFTGNKTISNISDLGSDSNNIFFIDGNLTINDNIIKTGNFLMIIVKGDITITDTVTRVDGILVANNIISTGTNATALTFNGSLYAANDINFTRSLGGSANNLNPAVIVNYDPKMIFYLPGTLAKVLTNWQWGN